MSWKIIYKKIDNMAKDIIVEEKYTNSFIDAWSYVPTELPWSVISLKTAEQLFYAVNRAVVAYRGNEMVVIEHVVSKPPCGIII